MREIYEQRLQQGIEFIAITGDLNVPPSHDSLQPLVGNGSSLVDIMSHPKFKSDGFPGTWRNGNAKDKLDYILMSPKLKDKVLRGGYRATRCLGRP